MVMPNWCLNRLEVCGLPADVEGFFTANFDRDEPTMLSFDKAVPSQNPVKDWGTKWDACDVIASGYNGYGDGAAKESRLLAQQLANGAPLTYFFDTAWSPPIEWLEKTAMKYPELRFQLSFAEPGMSFCGEHLFEHGELVEDFDLSHIDYPFCESRDLLQWPCCDDCGERLSESRISTGECYCPPCEETNMMSRGSKA